MDEKERNVKEQFKQKVAGTTDAQLKDGYGYLKKQHRVKNEDLSSKRAKVEELLQHEILLEAKGAVSTAENEESIIKWKKDYVEEEMIKRFKEIEENDKTFDEKTEIKEKVSR